MYEAPIVDALRTARFGSGSSSPSSNRIMKSTQRFSSEVIAATIGSICWAVRPQPSKDTRDFGGFFRRNFPRFANFALQLALVMLLIGARREKSAEPHGDRAGGDFRQPRQHHDRRAHLRSGKPGRQRKWNRQAVRHADDHVAHDVAGGEVVLDVRALGCRFMLWLRINEFRSAKPEAGRCHLIMGPKC